jgi:hypothetical protein
MESHRHRSPEDAVRYLCLCYRDPSRAGPDDANEALRADAGVLAAASLEGAEGVATLRVRNGRLAVEDGRAEGGAETLHSVALVEARDLNQAIRLAASFPAARAGRVEVRPAGGAHA